MCPRLLDHYKSAIEVNKEGKEVKKKEKQVRQEYDQMQPEIERMKLKIAEAEKYILYSGDLEAMSILEIAKNDSTEYFQILNGSKNKGNTTMNHVINMFLEGGDYTDAEISLLVNYSICSIESDARMASINNL
jgi:hypothetical protein